MAHGAVPRKASHGVVPTIDEVLADHGARRERIELHVAVASAPGVQRVTLSGDDGGSDVEPPTPWLVRAIDGTGSCGIGIKDSDVEGHRGALAEFLYGPEATRSAANDGDLERRSHSDPQSSTWPSTLRARSSAEMPKCSVTQASL